MHKDRALLQMMLLRAEIKGAVFVQGKMFGPEHFVHTNSPLHIM